MQNIDNLQDMNEKIRSMQAIASQLAESAKEIPAVYRNLARIKASLKMLELNISDVVEGSE